MDFVILDTLDADWLKSSEADVQGDIDGLDAALADAVEDFRCEMEAGGRSGYGAPVAGIDGLIAFAVIFAVIFAAMGRIRPRNVRREWDVADAIENGVEIVNRLEANMALAERGAGENFRLQFIALPKKQLFSNAELAARLDQAFPIVGLAGELAREKNLDTALKKIASGGIVRAYGLNMYAFAPAIKPCGKDAGIVEDQQIAGVKQVGKVAELAIGVVAAGALQMQHPRAVTSRERLLGNESGGEMEMEVGN